METKPKVLVNFTGHPLVVKSRGKEVTLPGGPRARIRSELEELYRAAFEGISVPILQVHEREVIGLPEPSDDTLYIVSGIVAAGAARSDVVAPSRVTRDNQGRVSECRALLVPILMGMGEFIE